MHVYLFARILLGRCFYLLLANSVTDVASLATIIPSVLDNYALLSW